MRMPIMQEQDREAAGRVGELMAQLKASETHKSMLQRSRWMLTAAALEKDDVLVSHADYVCMFMGKDELWPCYLHVLG